MRTILGLALVFALSVTACGQKPAPTTAATSPGTPAASADAGPEQPKANDPNDPFTKLRPWKSNGPEVKKTANGVEYVILAHGDPKGVHPKATDAVEVQYDGRLAATGHRFDFTPGEETASFPLNRVIPGWTEGLQELIPGDKAMFFIPSKMGYGPDGAGDRIPANSDLMFLVTLKKILQPKLADEAAWKKALPWPKTGPVKTKSGLEYIVLSSGPKSEEPPSDNDGVMLFYSGRLADGKEFDTTYGAPNPAPMGVGDLIPGWREALKLMRPGDHWILRIPANLAFGDKGNGPIPPKAPIFIEVEVAKVIRIPASPTAPDAPAPK